MFITYSHRVSEVTIRSPLQIINARSASSISLVELNNNLQDALPNSVHTKEEMTTTSACEKPDVTVELIITSLLIYSALIGAIPYLVKVVREKNTKGVSMTTVFLLTFATFTNSTGGVIQNWQQYQCCGQGKWTFGECYISLTPSLVIISYFLGLLPLCALCVYYFTPPFELAQDLLQESHLAHDAKLETNGTEVSVSVVHVSEFKYANPATRKRTYVLFILVLTYMVAVILTASVVMSETGSHSGASTDFATGLNILAGCLMLVSWIPQILHTYRIKSAGSVSVVSLAIQAPQTLMLVVLLILDGQKITIVAPAIVSFTCMSIIVALCVRYTRLEKQRLIDHNDRDYVEDSSSDDDKAHADP